MEKREEAPIASAGAQPANKDLAVDESEVFDGGPDALDSVAEDDPPASGSDAGSDAKDASGGQSPPPSPGGRAPGR